MMEKELLQQIINKLTTIETDIKEIKTDIKDLKQSQIRIESKFDELEGKNANNHIEILNKNSKRIM